MIKFLPLCLGFMLLSASAAPFAQEAQTQLPRTTLSIGVHQIEVQIASTNEETSTGLMYRQAMPTSEGMLFVFPQTNRFCFWMKNTPLPLTVAFIADDGSIVNLENMKPHSLDSHCSAKPVRYVLEMNQGWFSKRGIQPGFKIVGKPFAQ